MARTATCERCDNTGWVCENHPDRPWRGARSKRRDACDCGAGAPCPACNASDRDHPPDLSRMGFQVKVDKDGDRH